MTPRTDGRARLLAPIVSVRPGPVDTHAAVDRLRLTLVSAGYALAAAPALALAIVLILSVPLGLISVGLPLALAAVPAASGGSICSQKPVQ